MPPIETKKMKNEDNLWQSLISFENMYRSFREAARGKRDKHEVAYFEMNLEENIINLVDELSKGIYICEKYTHFFIHEPKERLISAAPFRDRVVHHALCNIIEPIFEKKFIYDSYANRKGKGNLRALERCTQFIRRFDYVLPMDVKQFFAAIDHALLIENLSKGLHDEKVLDLCKLIIHSGAGILNTCYEMVYFSGDDLLAGIRPRGLPIGNLTSQFWANVYLNGLDHYIKRDLKCRGYVRYVDDLLLFSNNKKELHEWKNAVINYLAGMRLTIHENSAQSRPCRVGVPFLGFQVFPDHRRLKRRKAVQARRRIKKLAEFYRNGEMDFDEMNSSIISWINYANNGDTWGLKKSIFRETIF